MAVDNYLYKYSDGSTGNSPYRRDASGNIVLNSAGGIADEGSFLGRTMPDGSINQATLGNVTADGRVNTYGGYSSSADEWFSGANANTFADRGATGANPAGQRAPDGFGYGAPSWQLGGDTKQRAPDVFGFGAHPAGAGAAPQTGGVMPAPGSPGGGTMSGQNPYLSQMGDALTQTMTRNWQRNVQPQIASSAMAAGGYGGSRQGVIEANSANDLNQGIGSALAGLYGNGYNTSLQYDLGVKNNQLGFGNLGLGYANLDRNINNDNNSWQLQGANFGLGVYDRVQQGNQAGIQAGTNIQNTPMNYWSQFGNQANSFGQGYGTTTGSTSQQGSPTMGALGGAQLGSQIGNWWNSNSNSGTGMTAAPQGGYNIGSYDYSLGSGGGGLGMKF